MTAAPDYQTLGRRAALAGLVAVPLAARAQTAPVPQVLPTTPPQVAVPAAPAAPRAMTPPSTAIDKTKSYYVFFEQQIDVNTMRALRRELAALVEAGVSQVTIVIDSPGGLIEPMLVTYSFIRALPITVNTHAQSFVLSAATVLFLAGEQRSADRNARFLFHPSTSQIVGTLTEQQVQDRVHVAEAVDASVAGIYQDRTKLTADQVQQFGREEVILTADQALAAGVVDRVADLKLPGDNMARMVFLD